MSKPSSRVSAVPHQPTLSYRSGYESQYGTKIQFQREWAKQHLLEGDGLLPLLYDHMWKSDKTREHHLKGVMIPDTVVFEHNFPRVWYTYDRKAHEITKRSGKLLDSHSIYQFFGEGDGGCDIVAQFYYRTSSLPGGGSSRTRPQSVSGSKRSVERQWEREEPATSVEFFTQETLFEFIHNRKQKPDGVLQKFLVPKGEHSAKRNFQIQAVWSPLVTLVYKRTNKKRLSDRALSLPERAATFDGPPHYSVESLIADSTKRRVDDTCRAIVHHFSITEHKTITRIVAYFKIDDNDDLWILWASSLRIGADRLNPSYLRVPMHLSMKVENTEVCGQDVSTSPPKKLEHDLLQQDIAMFDLTGDYAFAKKCLGKRYDDSNTSPPRSISNSPQRESSTPARPALDTEQLKHSRIHPQPPSSSHLYYSSETSSRHGAKHDVLSMVEEMQHAYISPRAPFLPLTARPEKLGVQSPRHPLHVAYQAEKEEEAKRTESTQTQLALKQRRFSCRDNKLQRPSGSATIEAKRSPLEMLKEDLLTAAKDAVYLAYSGALESQPPQSKTEGFTAPTVTLELGDQILATLLPTETDELLRIMHFTPAPGTDGRRFVLQEGVLQRGGRKDRPVAQITADVEEYLDEVFDEKGPELLARWKSHLYAVDQEAKNESLLQ